eukprot:CAMPEP_0169149510 /NCGR_PEP_ID=MMETSP1015-20121227/49567_1 /TAXON_ID=342587 /ORGANISM="Karlodinium micrum, Strain CCMP2283" /LENGTH=45 /DNA_ID= /DNA_START= /DNA_END= /DNA_ORIENTATION=
MASIADSTFLFFRGEAISEAGSGMAEDVELEASACLCEAASTAPV